MNKTERLELENKVLKGMLSDIQISIQGLHEGPTSENSIHMILGCIEYIAGDFEGRLKRAERQYEIQKNRRRTSQ